MSWASSPTRFREDTNAEEDLRVGGYAETWCVELLQNAADAARAAGVPGRVRIEVVGSELRVANTGAPLHAAGVAALASLRASSKRDEPGATGRFGVGFAAVLAVTDAPRVLSTTGGVRFSAADTAAEVDRLPGPAAERARDGRVPVLRLVWPVSSDEDPLPDGWTTEVRLPLREPGPFLDLARRDVPDLLLALPGLDVVEIGGGRIARRRAPDGTVRIGSRRWRTVTAPVPGGDAPLVWAAPLSAGPTTDRHSDAVPETSRGLSGRGASPGEAVRAATDQRSDVRPETRRGLSGRDASPGEAVHTEANRGAAGGSVSGAGSDADPAPVGTGAAARGRLDDDETLHAPTATAERLSLPARLIAPFPLDPDRRRVRQGPRTDGLVAAAGAAYVDLVRATPLAERTGLVPEPDFPRSPLDGRLREAVTRALASADWLPGAAGSDLAPSRAEWLDVPGADGLPELLAGPTDPGGRAERSDGPGVRAELSSISDVREGPTDPGGRAERSDGPGVRAELSSISDVREGAFGRLLASGVAPPAGLDVERVSPAELADRLLGVPARPEWWHRLYAALDGPARTVPGLVDELRALPVPLADGRVVRGPASVLLPGPDADPVVAAVAELGLSGLHVAAPAAVHPLLRRLGAGDADREALRADPALREAVARSLDDADDGLDVEPLARAVLALLTGPAEWAGALALTDAEGVPTRADELVLPDAAVRPLLHPDAPVGVLDGHWLDVDRDALVAAGVLDGFAVTASLDRLDDGERWSDEHSSGAHAERASADDAPDRVAVGVRDLDLVADDAWPDALRLIQRGRDTRAALLTPDGYTSWWLARHALLGGHAPAHWRLPSSTTGAGLLDPVPVTGVDDAVLAAAGVRTDLHVVDAADAADLLARLADPSREVATDTVAAAHRALTDALAAGRVDVDDVDPPDRVRTTTGATADAGDAVVLDVPWALPALDERTVVTGGDPERLAELLDLPLASDTVTGDPVGAGTARRWAELTEVVVACHTLGLPIPAGEVLLHDHLEVDLTAPRTARITVPTWPGSGGRPHASDPVRALIAVLAGDLATAAGSAAGAPTVLGNGRDRVETG